MSPAVAAQMQQQYWVVMGKAFGQMLAAGFLILCRSSLWEEEVRFV